MALFVRHFANYDKTQLDLSKEEDYRLLDVLKYIQYLLSIPPLFCFNSHWRVNFGWSRS